MFQLSSRTKDMAGQVLGSLTVLAPTGLDHNGEVLWECRCICGEHVTRPGTQLRRQVKAAQNPRSPSCGCLLRELALQNAKSRFTKHGYAKAEDRHPLYSLYWKVMSRCHSPDDTNYPRYGAKGVYVCDEWRNDPGAFVNWCLVNGWKPGLQLDKDILCDELGISPKRYSPETCQFITAQQNVSKSASRNTYGTNKRIKLSQGMLDEMRHRHAQGETKASLAREYGISKTHASRLLP